MDNSFADRWFTALDERQIGQGPSQWIAQVLSVHTERDGAWVQIAPSDNPFATIVLHVSSSTAPNEAVKALELQRRSNDSHSAIIDLFGEPALSARHSSAAAARPWP